MYSKKEVDFWVTNSADSEEIRQISELFLQMCLAAKTRGSQHGNIFIGESESISCLHNAKLIIKIKSNFEKEHKNKS